MDRIASLDLSPSAEAGKVRPANADKPAVGAVKFSEAMAKADDAQPEAKPHGENSSPKTKVESSETQIADVGETETTEPSSAVKLTTDDILKKLQVSTQEVSAPTNTETKTPDVTQVAIEVTGPDGAETQSEVDETLIAQVAAIEPDAEQQPVIPVVSDAVDTPQKSEEVDPAIAKLKTSGQKIVDQGVTNDIEQPAAVAKTDPIETAEVAKPASDTPKDGHITAQQSTVAKAMQSDSSLGADVSDNMATAPNGNTVTPAETVVAETVQTTTAPAQETAQAAAPILTAQSTTTDAEPARPANVIGNTPKIEGVKSVDPTAMTSSITQASAQAVNGGPITTPQIDAGQAPQTAQQATAPIATEAPTFSAVQTAQSVQPAPQTPPVQAAVQAPVNMTAPGWGQTVVDTIKQQVAEGITKVDLTLHPEKMGTLQIRMDLRGEAAQVMIVTETAEASRVFNDNMHRLGDMFAKAGLDLNQNNSQAFQQNSERRENGDDLLKQDGSEPLDTDEPLNTPNATSLVDMVA